MRSHATYGIHFYDGLIVASVERAGCPRIWSEDLNPGQEYFGVKVARSIPGIIRNGKMPDSKPGRRKLRRASAGQQKGSICCNRGCLWASAELSYTHSGILAKLLCFVEFLTDYGDKISWPM